MKDSQLKKKEKEKRKNSEKRRKRLNNKVEWSFGLTAVLLCLLMTVYEKMQERQKARQAAAKDKL